MPTSTYLQYIQWLVLTSSLLYTSIDSHEESKGPKERDVAMVRWVVGSILHGGPIELFLIPASAPRLV